MSDASFPVACPKCDAPAGRPYRTASASNGITLVGVRCSVCQHKWDISRPVDDTSATPARTPSMVPAIPSDVTGLNLRRGDHACAIYSSTAELVRIAADFIVDGLRRQQRCWYVTCGRELDALRDALLERQIDVEHESARGALQLISGEGTYLTRTTFDPERVVTNFNEAIEGAYADGFTGFRAAADMSWALDINGGPQPLIIYEAMLRALFSTSRATGLCLYDRTKMPLDVIDGALATHPKICAGGVYRGNQYYDPARTHAVPVDDAAVIDKLRQLEQ